MDKKIRNLWGPLFLIVVVPLLLFLVLIKLNNVSELIYPNLTSSMMFFGLLLYGYLSIILSNKEFIGPTNVDNETPTYADNGFNFWIITTLLVLFVSVIFKEVPKIFVKNYIPFILTSNIFGLLFVAYLYFTGRNDYYGKEEDEKSKFSELFLFLRGLKFHPRLFGVDIKQLTNCRFGMISWQIIILLFAIYYFRKNGFNLAILTTVLLQSIYIGKFFYWETGYFNTLDITLDRAGYYLCWGCLVFIPSMYTFTTYYLINNKPEISELTALIIFALGLYFTYKNYEVDYQKELFKRDKENTLIDGEKCEYLPVSYEKNGKTVDSKLLLSGHWGFSRHTNYTYELLTALTWSAVGYNQGILSFVYFIYLTILLNHRIFRDEKKCKDKYGKDWDKYCEKVKYRLIKNVY